MAILLGACVKTRLVVGVTASLVLGLAGATEKSGGACTRECLEGIAHKYVDALAQRNPSAAPLAEHVEYTENNVELLLGDGLWGTITSKGPPSTELLFADPQGGQVGFFGIVEEHGVPGYFGVRLKVEDRRITEIETVVNRIPPLP